MLQLKIEATDLWDERKEEFVYVKEQTIKLEHSLVSVSKWESKWNKSFLESVKNFSLEESLDYIKCMTITQNVDPYLYSALSSYDIQLINNYIDSPMTATTIRELKENKKKEIITSEIIYYWMILFRIPFECQKWHLNRLLTLIKVCSIKSQPEKKMTKRETMLYQHKLNEERKIKYNTKG